ncbi:MAG: hypothetical protein H8E66_34995 [Planctomycetes bacterium]|jgi:hypothetical protein|nr:hypothetical protein [Planctomycetota bacterium]
MRKSRSTTMDPSVMGTYHIYCRTVRRAFLLGMDKYLNKDFSHRRTWVKERVEFLAAYFAIDVLFFAFLSNHTHIILRNLPAKVEGWSDEEVIRRGCRVFPYKFKRLGVKNSEPTEKRLKELVRDRGLVNEMRKRLADPSWFKRQLNQYIATRANKEDECTGHFFQGRFEHEPISSLFALLICAMYVDLNEFAAKMSESPSVSTSSSIYHRLQGRAARKKGKPASGFDGFLAPIFKQDEPQGYQPAGQLGSRRMSDDGLFDMTLDDYVECLEMLAKQVVEARLIGKGKPPINKDDVTKLLQQQENFVAFTSDLPT